VREWDLKPPFAARIGQKAKVAVTLFIPPGIQPKKEEEGRPLGGSIRRDRR